MKSAVLKVMQKKLNLSRAQFWERKIMAPETTEVNLMYLIPEHGGRLRQVEIKVDCSRRRTRSR